MIESVPNFTQCYKNSDLRHSPQVFLKKSMNELLFDINDEIICLVSVLTGCNFSGTEFSRGHRLILFKPCRKQERGSQVKKHLRTTLMYRLKTALKSREMIVGTV